MSQADTRVDPALDELRQLRSELRESMDALESALAAPAVERLDFWAERVAVALVEMSGDFRTHVTVTEGPDGLHRDIALAAPRLINAVDRLSTEHVDITALIEELLAATKDVMSAEQVDSIRDRAVTLLGKLVRHRQRGADLIFEAYEADIGGET